jgi:hypothetical protein
MSEKLTDEILNQWIAENVFGECWHEWVANGLGDRFACVRPKCFEITQFDVPSNPDYCNDISEAWRIVEKVCEENEFDFLFTKNERSIEVQFFDMFRDTYFAIENENNNPARAIAEAAKKILEGK